MLKSAIGVFFVLAVSITATAAPKSAAVIIEADDIKWVSEANQPDVKMGVVEGNSKAGPHHAFAKFKAGWSVPAHFHTANQFVSVVAGTLILNVDGKEYKLEPGSYFEFKNKTVHTTRCDDGAECILFMDSRGKWDAVMKDDKAQKSAKAVNVQDE